MSIARRLRRRWQAAEARRRDRWDAATAAVDPTAVSGKTMWVHRALLRAALSGQTVLIAGMKGVPDRIMTPEETLQYLGVMDDDLDPSEARDA